MIVDKKDAVGTLQARHAQAQAQMLPMARILAGEAPLMDGLARSPEWERYCTYLQGIAEQFKARKQVAQERLGDPSITKDEEVRKLRQDIFIADITLQNFAFAIGLPAAIVKGGEEATQFIATFEKKNENAS